MGGGDPYWNSLKHVAAVGCALEMGGGGGDPYWYSLKHVAAVGCA